MNKSLKYKKGFTLTEILVVVLIISILAAVVYPLYTKSITKSRAVEAINLLEIVRNKQLQKYAKDQQYYSDFNDIGQLTSNKENEVVVNSGAQLKVKDYTLSLNNNTNCMNAEYRKGSATFKFSSSYDNAGLGCTGSICSSFGDIIGDAKSVCNCGGKTCPGAYQVNEDTCNCDCHMECNINGSCYNKTQTKNTTQSCGYANSGTQTRTCYPDCYGGYCTDFGLCTGQSCNESTKPATQQNCGNCGTQTRIVACNSTTGQWGPSTWGTCTGQGVCTPGAKQSCGNGGTQTCSSSCGWGPCSGQTCDENTKPATQQSCGNCGTQTRTVTCNSTTGQWGPSTWGTCTGQGICTPGAEQACGNGGKQICSSSCGWGTCSGQTCDESTKPAIQQNCGKCGTQTRVVACNSTTGQWGPSTWGECTGQGVCTPGTEQACGGGNGMQTCSSSCGWDACSCNKGFHMEGGTCQPDKVDCQEANKPATTQACGKCGTQPRPVTCDTSNGTWQAADWGTCTGETGACKPGETGSCGPIGTWTCTDQCTIGWCKCIPGYKLDPNGGNFCVENCSYQKTRTLSDTKSFDNYSNAMNFAVQNDTCHKSPYEYTDSCTSEKQCMDYVAGAKSANFTAGNWYTTSNIYGGIVPTSNDDVCTWYYNSGTQNNALYACSMLYRTGVTWTGTKTATCYHNCNIVSGGTFSGPCKPGESLTYGKSCQCSVTSLTCTYKETTKVEGYSVNCKKVCN